MRVFHLFVLVASLAVLFDVNFSFAEVGYFSGYVSKVQQSAQEASQAATLEDLQSYARQTMALAEEFQKQAQAVNDLGFVNEAVDIYNSAYRAVQSGSLKQAREYARQAASYAQVVAEQAGISIHDPGVRQEQIDIDDDALRSYDP